MDLNNIYHQLALTEMKRMLSLQNREPLSVSAGCFDRTYWCWKFTDFPGARFQEGVYSLSHFYKHSFEGNPLFSKEKVLHWIEDGFTFWKNIQYPDGSFDEAYPYERSLAAVGFTGFYLGEAYRLVKNDLSPTLQTELEEAFFKAGKWLTKNDERHGVLTNHLAAASAALYNIYLITNETTFRERSQYFLERILAQQSKEGWYEEYGGFDPGYQTHALFYLARIWQLTKNEKLQKSIESSIQFLQNFIHPDGTLGGEYSSRGTEFYYPAGLEIFSECSELSQRIAGFMKTSVAKQKAAGLSAMDAYNFFPLLNNYLFAAINDRSNSNTEHNLPFMEKQSSFFPEAGLMVKSNENYFAIIGLSKGGTVKIFPRNAAISPICDSGYLVESEEGVFSNQSFSKGNPIIIEDESVSVATPFYKSNQKIMNPWLFLCFRIFTLTLGKVPFFSYWVKNLLVKVLVRGKKKAPLGLKRTIHLLDKKISITDHLSLSGDFKIKKLASHTKFSTIHMGSSRYFQEQELEMDASLNVIDKAKDLMLSKALELKRSIEF